MKDRSKVRPSTSADERLEKSGYEGVIYYTHDLGNGKYWDERDAADNPDYAGSETVTRIIDGERVECIEKTYNYRSGRR